MFCDCYTKKNWKKQNHLEQRIMQKVIEDSCAPMKKESIEINMCDQDKYIKESIKDHKDEINEEYINFDVVEHKLVKQRRNKDY